MVVTISRKQHTEVVLEQALELSLSFPPDAGGDSRELENSEMKVRVECYSGYKADERPCRFFLGERCYHVLEIADQWYGPGNSYFKVRADDANFYILRNAWGEEPSGWFLDAYRQS